MSSAPAAHYANVHADFLDRIGQSVVTYKRKENKMTSRTAKKNGKSANGMSVKRRSVRASAVRRRLGISRTVFARLTGFSERAIAGWEGGAPISAPGLRRLREI